MKLTYTRPWSTAIPTSGTFQVQYQRETTISKIYVPRATGDHPVLVRDCIPLVQAAGLGRMVVKRVEEREMGTGIHTFVMTLVWLETGI